MLCDLWAIRFRGREAHRRLWRPRGFSKRHLDGRDLQIFEKHGLDVEIVMITGAARSVAALLGNSTHFATGSATGPLAAAVRGSDLKVIAASYNKFPYAFVVKPEIRNPKELRGKRVNILNYGGSNDLALQLALKEWGMKLSDVQVIIGGDAPTRMGALMSGRIDATILSPPHLTIAVKAGYRVLADMGDMSANFTQSSLYVKGSSLKENRDRVKRFLRGYAEAIHVIKTDRDRTMKVFANRMRIDDPETVRIDLRIFRAPLFFSAACKPGRRPGYDQLLRRAKSRFQKPQAGGIPRSVVDGRIGQGRVLQEARIVDPCSWLVFV